MCTAVPLNFSLPSLPDVSFQAASTEEQCFPILEGKVSDIWCFRPVHGTNARLTDASWEASTRLERLFFGSPLAKVHHSIFFLPHLELRFQDALHNTTDH